MIFMFRTRTWVPGRAVPWGLGRSPWAPGARPRGSQGGVLAESLQVVGGYASRGFASKIMSILMSIFGRLGVHLGSLWGVMLGSCWHLFRPKWVPEPSSNRLIIEKVIFHETLRFPILVGQNGPQDRAKIDPRSLQDGSKIVLDRFFSS